MRPSILKFLSRLMTFANLCGIFINGYIYFIVIKEGINQARISAGYRNEVDDCWIWCGRFFRTYTGSEYIGRTSWSLIYAGANLAWLRKVEDSSLASGTSPWWNSMALEMIMAFALVFGPILFANLRFGNGLAGILFMAAFIATQSRGGLVAFGGMRSCNVYLVCLSQKVQSGFCDRHCVHHSPLLSGCSPSLP